MKPTIEKIAHSCGVSRGTVDRVLHNRPHVQPEIRARVEQALEEYGYAPLASRKRVPKEVVTVAILLPKWHDNYFARQTYAGINQAEHAIHDAGFRIISYELASREESEYLAAIHELMKQGIQGLILNAAYSQIMQLKINELAENGITVMTYDADVPESKRVCYFGQDIYASGKIAAGLMQRFMRPQEQVLIVTGNMSFQSSRSRVDGFVQHLLENGYATDCYQIVECHEQYELTRTLVSQALQQNAMLRHIYLANSSISGGIEGIRRARPMQRVYVICHDLTPAAKKYLLAGQIDFVVGQDFTQKVYKALMTLYQHLCLGISPKREFLYTDSFIITKELL